MCARVIGMGLLTLDVHGWCRQVGVVLLPCGCGPMVADARGLSLDERGGPLLGDPVHRYRVCSRHRILGDSARRYTKANVPVQQQ